MDEGLGTAHVPPMELWGYTNGMASLSDEHFEHLVSCFGCQMLVREFIDALEELPPPDFTGKAA